MMQTKILSGGGSGRRGFSGGGGGTPGIQVFYGPNVPPPPSPVGLPNGSLYFQTASLGKIRFLTDASTYAAINGSNIFYNPDFPNVNNWTRVVDQAGLNAIAVGNGYFIVVGNGGYAKRSTDGATWTATNLGFLVDPTNNIKDICYSPADSLFYAVVNSALKCQIWSYDALLDVAVMVHEIDNSEPDKLYAVGASYYCVSPLESTVLRVEALGVWDDGTDLGYLRAYKDFAGNWIDEYTPVQMPPLIPIHKPTKFSLWNYPTLDPLEFPHWGFVATFEEGYVRLLHSNVYTYSNGLISNTTKTLYDCHCDTTGKIVVVGADGTINSGVVTATIGMSLTARVTNTTQTLQGICHDGTQYVVTGNGVEILLSNDGITWTKTAANIAFP